MYCSLHQLTEKCAELRGFQPTPKMNGIPSGLHCTCIL